MDNATQATDPRPAVDGSPSTPPPPSRAGVNPAAAAGLLSAEHRTATIGILGLVSLIAFEAMGSATVMPAAATDLDGLARYGFLFGGPLATSLVGMVVAGDWSDRHSPVAAVRAGIGCFITGLLVSALAASVDGLLCGRLVSGFGAGMMAVSLYALVGRLYPAHLHSAVFAAFSAAWIVPALLGPAGCGLLTQWLGWRAALLGIAVLGLPIAWLLFGVRVPPRAGDSPRRGSAHAIPWALAAAAGALAVHAVGQANDAPGASTASAGAWPIMVASLALLLVAACRLLPPGTLRARRGLPAAIALNGLSQAAFFAAEAFLPLLLHRERQLPISVSGVLLSIGAVSWSLGAAYRARMHRRIDDDRLLQAGFALLACGIAASASLLMPIVPLSVAIAGWTAAGAGMGLISPTLSVTTLALAPPGEHGRTGASLRLSAALSTTSALALSGALFAQLLVRHPTSAFACSIGLAASLAAVGWIIARRGAVGT